MIEKIIGIFVLSLALVGCGEKEVSKSAFGDVTTFHVGAEQWQVGVPDSWERVPTTTYPEAVYIAREGAVNFIILYRSQYEEGVLESMIEGAKQEFFSFELMSQEGLSATFSGKVEANLPVRQFMQKIEPLEGGDFLLGTCSFTIMESAEDLCQDILDGWRSVKQENK